VNLGVVLLLVGTDQLIMIARWMVLLRSTGQPAQPRSLASIYFIGAFVGSVVPSVGGDVSRAIGLARQSNTAVDAIASVAVDRLIGMVSIVVLGLATASTWAWRSQLARAPWALAMATLAVAVIGLVFWADVLVRRLVPSDWHAVPIVGRLIGLLDAVARYRSHRTALASVLLLALGVQVIRILEVYLLGRGLSIDVEFSYYLLVMPAGLVALNLPLSIAGFGLPQGIIVWLLQPRGVPDTRSFALSMLFAVATLAATAPGAWLYLRASRR
jgi:uncharacterized membrane protein YbhN (UPF0104 family)